MYFQQLRILVASVAASLRTPVQNFQVWSPANLGISNQQEKNPGDWCLKPQDVFFFWNSNYIMLTGFIGKITKKTAHKHYKGHKQVIHEM